MMEPNKKALIVLLTLVLTSVIVFCAEMKFLVPKPRGSTTDHYKNTGYADKIILLVEDFEGLETPGTDLHKEKFFDYGSAKISIDTTMAMNDPVAVKTALKVMWAGSDNYGGWGKGVGANLDLDTAKDFLSFRIYVPADTMSFETIKITLEEDDDDDGKLQKDKDDAWYYELNIKDKGKWKMVSIPLKDFKDDNPGGDHKFNVTKKGGLHTIIFAFQHPDKYTIGRTWYFDFICFTGEKLPESVQ
ncbi:MAG: glycan-binding surface protein [Bacteroidia bacterium]